MTAAETELPLSAVLTESDALLTECYREQAVERDDPLLVALPEPYGRADFERAAAKYAQQDWAEMEAIVAFHQERAATLRLMKADPLHHGFEPDWWREADTELAAPDKHLLASFGMNRGSKTFHAAKRACEAVFTYPGSKLLILGETKDSSIQTQQEAVRHYLEPHFGALNWKEDVIWKWKWTQSNGFTDGTIVLPNRSLIKFDVFGAEPSKYEGWEFGARNLKEVKVRTDGTPILNTGFWADESMPLAWLRMIMRRLTFNSSKLNPLLNARGFWTFTPVGGITPAMKEYVGTPRIRRTSFCKLLPAIREAGCPPGHLPVVADAGTNGGAIYWTHLDRNPNPFNNYMQIVEQNCAGKDQDYIARLAYGYARDNVGRQFGNFGPWNVIDEEHLPLVGTDYRIVDPHTRKPYFFLYARVTPGDWPDYYIWYDWPDAQTYGEWAVPTERETNQFTRGGWDGDPGPAQNNLNFGYLNYKRVWRDLETVSADVEPEKDPKRRAFQLTLAGGEKKRMPVFGVMDSRGGPLPQLVASGHTCPLHEFAKEHVDPETGGKLPAEHFRLASGEKIDLNIVRELLQYRRDETGSFTQAPRLYVVRRCRQVCWAFENYTGKAGADGACKEVIDCVRYLAGSRLRHVDPEESAVFGGGAWT